MNKGGRYIVNQEGERELVECTAPAGSKDTETKHHANDATVADKDAAKPQRKKTGTRTDQSSSDVDDKDKPKRK